MVLFKLFLFIVFSVFIFIVVSILNIEDDSYRFIDFNNYVCEYLLYKVFMVLKLLLVIYIKDLIILLECVYLLNLM